MELWVQILTAVVAAGGGGTAIALGITKWAGKTLIEGHVKRLEEDYKNKLNLEFDRIAKLNQREFEVLPQLWDFVVTIRNQLFEHLDDGKFVSVDLNSFPADVYKNFVDEQPFNVHLKARLLASANRNVTYIAIQNLTTLELCKSNFHDFDLLYKRNKIFLTGALAESIGKIHQYLFDSIGIATNIQPDRERRKVFQKDFENISTPMQEELGLLIKKRLQFRE